MSSDEDEAESYENQIELFDEQLLMAISDNKKLSTYADYIEFEKEMAEELKTSARVRIVYERAVADFPTSEELWLDYASWVGAEKTDNALNVYERGCAACPDCTALWQLYLLALEREGVPYDKLLDKWEGAKASIANEQDCISIYRSFIYLTHRYLVKNGTDDLSPVENLFAEGLTLLKKNFEIVASADAVQFRKNYAYYLYSKLKKHEPASSLWKEILTQTFAANRAAEWLEYLLLERLYGSVAQVRHQFYTALARVTDAPYDLFAAFVQFEREEGTLEQLERALDAVNKRNWQLPQKSAAAKKANNNKVQKSKNQVEKIEDSRKPAAAGKLSTGVKRAGGRDESAGFVVLSKKTKAAERPAKRASKESEDNVDEHCFKRPQLPPPRKAEPKAKKEASVSLNFNVMLPLDVGSSAVEEMDAQAAEESGGQSEATVAGDDKTPTPSSFQYSTGVEKNKLFVRNVHFACSEDELKEHFSLYGVVESVRIVTHKDGKPKGVAYVDFTNDDEAQKGLRADGVKLRDRKLKVFISNPPPKDRSVEKPKEKPQRDTNILRPTQAATALSRPTAEATAARVPRGLFVPRSVAKLAKAPAANGVSNGTNGK